MPKFIQNNCTKHSIDEFKNKSIRNYLKMVKVCKSQRIESFIKENSKESEMKQMEKNIQSS